MSLKFNKKTKQKTLSFWTTKQFCSIPNVVVGYLHFKRLGCISGAQTNGNRMKYDDDKKKKKINSCLSCALDVFKRTSSYWSIQFCAGWNSARCSMWLKAGHCSKMNCTWRLKSDSQHNTVHHKYTRCTKCSSATVFVNSFYLRSRWKCVFAKSHAYIFR